MWIESSTGKVGRWLPVHSSAELLGERVCRAVIFLVCFHGCDSITICWEWKTNCMKNMEGFPEVKDTFIKLSTEKNFNQRFRNDWSFRRLHVWQELSPQKCWQMLQVSTYTDESHNVQLPTYTRCFAATRSPGKATARHMGALHDTGQNLSKFAIFRLFCGWQRREVASTDNITKSIISM